MKKSFHFVVFQFDLFFFLPLSLNLKMRNSNIACELLVNSIGSENEENGVKIVRLRMHNSNVESESTGELNRNGK